MLLYLAFILYSVWLVVAAIFIGFGIGSGNLKDVADGGKVALAVYVIALLLWPISITVAMLIAKIKHVPMREL